MHSSSELSEIELLRWGRILLSIVETGSIGRNVDLFNAVLHDFTARVEEDSTVWAFNRLI